MHLGEIIKAGINPAFFVVLVGAFFDRIFDLHLFSLFFSKYL